MEQKTKDQEVQEESLLRTFGSSTGKSMLNKQFIIVVGIVLLLGVGTGYLLAQRSGSSSFGNSSYNSSSSESSIKTSKGTIVGSEDLKTFKDQAEGKLVGGGIDGEGQFHLVRPGGESQNVYITSSIVDLSSFIGKKIRVWGQTQTAKKAGWLMDVGRVEVLE